MHNHPCGLLRARARARARARSSRRRTHAVLAVCVGLGVAFGRTAAAVEPRATPQVAWTGPSTCPRTAFDRALARHLAETDTELAGAHRIRVDVTREAAEHWRIELVFETGEEPGGTRSLEGRSCAMVTDAAAWIVAIAVDPSVADRVLGPEPDEEDDEGDEDGEDGEATVPTPPEPAAPEEPLTRETAREREADRPTSELDPIPRRSTPERPGLRIFAGAEIGPDGGALPGVGALVRGRMGVGGRAWRVDLTGAVRTPTQATLAAPSSVGARFDLWLVGVQAGPVLGVWPVGNGTLELPLWLGFEIGQVTARAFGFDDARTVSRPFLGTAAGAALAWAPRPRFAVRLGAELVVAPWRHEFFVGGLGPVHRTGWVTGRGTLGFEVRLGAK